MIGLFFLLIKNIRNQLLSLIGMEPSNIVIRTPYSLTQAWQVAVYGAAPECNIVAVFKNEKKVHFARSLQQSVLAGATTNKLISCRLSLRQNKTIKFHARSNFFTYVVEPTVNEIGEDCCFVIKKWWILLNRHLSILRIGLTFYDNKSVTHKIWL